MATPASDEDVRKALAALPAEAGATVYDAASGDLEKVAHRDPLPGGGFQAVVLNADDFKWPFRPSSIQP